VLESPQLTEMGLEVREVEYFAAVILLQLNEKTYKKNMPTLRKREMKLSQMFSQDSEFQNMKTNIR